MDIVFFNIYHEEIEYDGFGYEENLKTKDCLIPPKGAEIRLNGKFWEVDNIIYNYDSMDVEIILNKDC